MSELQRVYAVQRRNLPSILDRVTSVTRLPGCLPGKSVQV
jgi:hypothetical protein